MRTFGFFLLAWVLVDNTNLVQDVIEYDGQAQYTPPAGLTLLQVPGNVQIGDSVSGDVFFGYSPIPGTAQSKAKVTFGMPAKNAPVIVTPQ